MAIERPEAVIFDVRALIPSHRHPLVFSVLEQLAQLSPQTPLWIVNDHNPQGLGFELDMRPETRDRYDFESESQPDGSWLAKMKRRQA
ncbi:MAG: DUF2249 domain-containing protein [Dehalococcoidia bacterium]|nr:DUF2249 domain-containing protein [Dehalococcoidia bacterium]